MNFDWRAPIKSSPGHPAAVRRKAQRADDDGCLTDDEPQEKQRRPDEGPLPLALERPFPTSPETTAAADACFDQLRSKCNAASSSDAPSGIVGASLGVLAHTLGFHHGGQDDFLLLLFGGVPRDDTDSSGGQLDFSVPLAVTVESIRSLFCRTGQLSLPAALAVIRGDLDESFGRRCLSQHSLFHQFHLFALKCAMLLGCSFVGPPRTTRAISIGHAVPTLMITLGTRSMLVAPFCTFLQERRVQMVTKDTWSMLCMFCQQMSWSPLDKYSNLDSWPTIIDEFVMWLRDLQS
jgi:hypothetical protein